MKVISVIIRTTLSCNLNCSYCYVNKSTSKQVIPIEVVKELIFGLINSGYSKINLYWHGGEPLIAGLTFYKNIVNICSIISEAYGIEINHKMQTNATLINQEWVDFFKTNNFKVGTSLDGNLITNKYRITKHGKNSFQEALHGIELMKLNGMDTSILSVLTRDHLSNLEAHYNFIKSIGVKTFKVNPCIVNKIEDLDYQVEPKEWGESMCQLFDLWYNDPYPPMNREFESIIRSMFVGHHTLCSFCKTCFVNFLSILPNGDMFPCAKLITEDLSFYLGNISQGITNILSNFSKLRREYENLGCNDCFWKEICNGGCSAYAFYANKNINTRDYLCEGYKILYRHIYDHVNTQISSTNLI